MVVVSSSEVWQKFLKLPLATATDFGVSLRLLELLEREYEALYVEDIQQITPEMVLRIVQVDKMSLKQLQISLAEMLKAVERGELEWIFNDMID